MPTRGCICWRSRCSGVGVLLPSAEVSALFQRSLDTLTAGGATVPAVTALPARLPAVQAATDLSFQCIPVHFKQGINEYLVALGPGAPLGTLDALIASGGYSNVVWKMRPWRQCRATHL